MSFAFVVAIFENCLRAENYKGKSDENATSIGGLTLHSDGLRFPFGRILCCVFLFNPTD